MFFATKLQADGSNVHLCSAAELTGVLSMVEDAARTDAAQGSYFIYVAHEGEADVGGPIDSYWCNPRTGEWSWVVGHRVEPPLDPWPAWTEAAPPQPAPPPASRDVPRPSAVHDRLQDPSRRPPAWESLVPTGT